jgi:hypothetical protein
MTEPVKCFQTRSPKTRLRPGAMRFGKHDKGDCPMGWTNCDGNHLLVTLPDRSIWDVDSRANNCSRPNDTEHRCWVRDGKIPKITAGKDGNTCSAGAGSIQSGSWHGFLRNGYLVVA